MGNSDRLIFYAKEMVAELTLSPKAAIDPFVVSKLDVSTINFFNFPKISKDENKYVMRKRGIAGMEYLMSQEKEIITRMARDIIDEAKDDGNRGIQQQQVKDAMVKRNLKVPSMLETYMNMCELLRLR